MRGSARHVLRRARSATCKIMSLFLACLFIQQSMAVSLDSREFATNRIYNGQDIKPGEFPFLVSVDGICGGSIIDDYHILTAAHCVTEYVSPSSDGYMKSPEFMAVKIGVFNTDLPNDGHLVKIDQITVHPKYHQHVSFPVNDIAILETNTAMLGVYPREGRGAVDKISIAAKPAFEGERLIVTGWGAINYTEYNGIAINRPVPRKTIVPAIAIEECMRENADNEGFVGLLCAGFPDGSSDSCAGDSGGPLFRHRGESPPELLGIVSFGPDCGSKEGYGVYTDVLHFSEWIGETTQRNETRRL